MVQLNYKQIMLIISAVLGVLMISTAQLTDLFGAQVAKQIVSIAALINTTLSSVLAVLTGQAHTVKEVAAMPGVEKIEVNTKANQVLAAIAVDPVADKVSPVAHKVEEVEAIAEGK